LFVCLFVCSFVCLFVCLFLFGQDRALTFFLFVALCPFLLQVLQISMNQEVDQTLRLRACAACNEQHYEASTICPSCNNNYLSCIGSGYPVVKMRMGGGVAECGKCSSVFDKKLWNNSLRHNDSKCLWCNEKGDPVY